MYQKPRRLFFVDLVNYDKIRLALSNHSAHHLVAWQVRQDNWM